MKFRKITSLFLATTMAVSSIFSSTSALAAEKASITEGLEEGSVGVKRNAEWVSNDTIKVDVSVDGVPKKEGIDAILIVDISGSMNSGTTGETYIPWDTTGTTPTALGLRNKATRQASEKFIETLYGSESDNRLAYGFFGTNSYDSSVIDLKKDANDILRGTLSKGLFNIDTSIIGDGTTPLKGDKGFISKKDSDFATTNSNMLLHAKNQLASEGTAYSKGVQLAKHYIDTRENKNRPVSIVFMSDGANALDGSGVLDSAIAELKNTPEYEANKLDLNSVGLDLTDGTTLESMLLGDGQSYKASSSDISSLSTAFETIVNRSQKAGTNAKITEKIAPEFELVDNPKAPEATIGKITKGTNELSWDVGNVTTKTETMTYYLKVKDTTETGKEYLVTDGATIEYVDVNGKDQNRNTDEDGNKIPYEDIIGEVIYKDINGNEIGRETVSGKPGSTQDIPVLDKLGYMPKTDSPKTITLDRDGNNVIDVIYVVDPNQKFKYTVKHIKPDGTELAPTETKEATVETALKASDLAKSVTGYTFGSGDPESITIEANDNNTITVKYIIDKNYTGFKGEVHYKVKGTDSYVPTLVKDKQISYVNGTLGEKKIVIYPETPGFIAVDGSKETEITLPEDPNKTEVKTVEYILDKTQKFGYEVEYVVTDKDGKEKPVPGLENLITTGYDKSTGILKGEGYYSEVKNIELPNVLGYKIKEGQQSQLTVTEKSENNKIKVTYEIDPNQKFGYEVKYYLEGTKTPVPGIDIDASKFPNAKYDSATGILSGTAPIETEIEVLKPISNKGYKVLDTTVEKIKVTTNSDINKKTVYYGIDDNQKFEYTIKYVKTGSNGRVLEEVKGSETVNKTIDIEIKSFKGLVLETTPQKQLKISEDPEKNIVEIRYKNDPSALYGYEVVSYYNDGTTDIEIGRNKSALNYQADSVVPVTQPKIEGYTIKSGQTTSIMINGDESQNTVRLEYTINKYKYEVSLLDQDGKPLTGLTKADLELLNPGKVIEYDPTTGKLTGMEEYGKEVVINLPTVLGYTTSDTVAKITIDSDESKNKSVVEYKSDYRNIIVKYKLVGKDVDLKAPVNAKLENTHELSYVNLKAYATGYVGDIAPSKISLYSYRSSTVFLSENTIVLYYK